MNAKPYRLRLTEHFFWYDYAKSGLSYEVQEGAIVTDPDAISRLEEFGAPVERIEIDPNSPPPII